MGLYGWAAVLSGAVLPQVAADYRLNPILSGVFVAIPSLGFTIAGFIGGLVSERVGLQRLLTASAIAITLTLGMVAIAPSMAIIFLASFLIGLSGGLLETGSNGLITSLYHSEAAPHVNRLHIFYGLGSFVAPLIVGGFVEHGAPWQFNFALACFLSLCLTVVFLRLPLTQGVGMARMNLSQMAKLIKRPTVLRASLGSMMFVASEIGLSSWLVMYLQAERGLKPSFSSWLLSIFWLAIIVGRFVNTRLPALVKTERIIFVEALGSILGTLGILFGKSPLIIAVGLIVTGLMMAGILPTLLAYACHESSENIGSISGITLSATGFGMLVGPGLIGLLMDYFGLYLAIFSVPLLLFFVLVIFVRRL